MAHPLGPDGLPAPEVGAWALDKHRLISIYARMFSRSMRGKWECLVYVEPFAGAGLAQLKDSARIVDGSPLLALSEDMLFDTYVFGEVTPALLDALRHRVAERFPNRDVRYVAGDANQEVDHLIDQIPHHRPGYRVLTFCVIDPCKLGDLRFETIRRLSTRFVDFLVLIPTHMDAHRNQRKYADPANPTVDLFVGDPQWRGVWREQEQQGRRFGPFVATYFSQRMKEIDYKHGGISPMMRTNEGLPLYHLAFFSRNPLGERFWRETLRYSSGQLPLLPGG